jgi:uncharacterized protein
VSCIANFTLLSIALLLTLLAGSLARAEDTPLQEPAGLETECDWLAAAPLDQQKPKGLVGIELTLVDVAAAQKACDEAIAQNPGEARFHYQAGRTAYAQGDYARALKHYSKAAELGHMLSMTAICGQYFTGRGVPQNHEQARAWCEKSAAAGDPSGMATLGFLYMYKGADADNMAKAKMWLDKSVAAGSPAGMYNFVTYYLRRNSGEADIQEARNWLTKAAETGYPNAMVLLGIWYAGGQNGLSVDYDEAQRWFQKGAKAGDFGGWVGLGMLYDGGMGLAQDYAKARQLYQKVADSHDPNNKRRAMIMIGLMYETGHGVPQDDAIAQSWYDKALAGTSEMERTTLTRLHDDGPPTKE